MVRMEPNNDSRILQHDWQVHSYVHGVPDELFFVRRCNRDSGLIMISVKGITCSCFNCYEGRNFLVTWLTVSDCLIHLTQMNRWCWWCRELFVSFAVSR